MKSVLSAVYDLFVGSGALYNVVGGRFFFQIAPQSTKDNEFAAFPHIVYSLVTSTLRLHTFSTSVENIVLQFSVFSKSYESTQAIYEQLKKCFDFAKLSISGYDIGMLVRETSNLRYEEENQIWHEIVSYRVMFEENE